MALLEIKLYEDEVLRSKAAPVKKIEERHRQLAADMAETMYKAKGIGLAANQIGLLERVIVVDTDWPDNEDKDWRTFKPTTMINPEVLAESDEDNMREEGCLSLPEINGDVWRPTSIKYRYTGLDGKKHEAEAEDLLARVILHEVDHLNGVLFIDRLPASERRGLAGQLNRLRRRKS